MLGGVAAVCALIPFAFYKYGEGIRRRYRSAHTAPKTGRDDVEQPRKREELVIPELSGSPGSTAATNRQGDKPAAEEDNDRNNAWTHVNVTAVKRRQKIDGGPDVKVSEPTSNEQRGGEALSRLVPRAIAKSRAGDQK